MGLSQIHCKRLADDKFQYNFRIQFVMYVTPYVVDRTVLRKMDESPVRVPKKSKIGCGPTDMRAL